MSEITATDPGDEDIPVQLPSGATFYCHPEEFDYLNYRVKRYMTDNKFTNISDLQDVDRMLVEELLCFRWGIWISRQRDYWGDPVDPNELQKALKEHSAELRQLKKMLGIDKVARDKERGDESLTAYLINLRQRAKQFGVMRDNQTAKAIELFQQASSLVTFHFNCTPEERKENHITADDFIEWFRDVAIPEFEEVDRHFRETNQKMWITEQ